MVQLDTFGRPVESSTSGQQDPFFARARGRKRSPSPDFLPVHGHGSFRYYWGVQPQVNPAPPYVDHIIQRLLGFQRSDGFTAARQFANLVRIGEGESSG